MLLSLIGSRQLIEGRLIIVKKRVTRVKEK